MLSLSPMKIIIIVAVVVMLLGPDKLPEVAHKIGSTWQSLRRFQQRVEDEVRGSLPDLPSTSDLARMARNPVTVLNQLADRTNSTPPPEEDLVTDSSTEKPLLPPLVIPPRQVPPSPSTGPISADPSLN
ncbi:MAG: hypothetical protein HKL85_02520 [Acidimicrobiaceae bacterium]|nr:hypothetical protein [Acidimicrobiaceae bacterium]